MKTRTAPCIQLCPRCGHMRINHPGAGLYDCPVDDEILEALRQYAQANGKRWKSKLIEEWFQGRDTGEALQRARLLIGSKRLSKIKL